MRLPLNIVLPSVLAAVILGGCTRHQSMTLYNAPPSIARYELGDDNRTHGDIIAWHADLAVDLDDVGDELAL